MDKYYDEEIVENYLRNKIVTNEHNMKKHITFNNRQLKKRTVFNNIIKYIDDFLDKDVYHRIITLPGLRGVGKTTLLFQVYDYFYFKTVSFFIQFALL